MKKYTLKKFLLLIPIAVLLITVIFLEYNVQYLKKTAYTFVYNTNVESVQRFSRQLNELSSMGYTSDVYGELFTGMIMSYNKTLGEKDALITFLMDEKREIRHSSFSNQDYLSQMLENEENIELLKGAFATRSYGEIVLQNGNKEEMVYFHRFYSGNDDYTLFMCIDKRFTDAQLSTDGPVMTICAVGLLLLIMSEYTVWLKLVCMPAPVKTIRKRDDNGD